MALQFKEDKSRSREYMNDMRYDAINLGSNEWFGGARSLVTYLSKVVSLIQVVRACARARACPLAAHPAAWQVSTNLDISSNTVLTDCHKLFLGGTPQPCIVKWALIEKAGGRVGVMGAVPVLLHEVRACVLLRACACGRACVLLRACACGRACERAWVRART